MGVYGGPDINESGLVLCLDAANPKSYVGSGITWRDLSGRGNTGTLVNGVGYSSANKGSLSFDGVNDYVEIPNSVSINSPLSSDFSYDVWVYQQLNGNVYGKIFSKGWTGSSENSLQLGLNLTGATKYANIELMVSGSAVYPGGFIIEPFKWCNIVITRSLGIMSVYSNSVLQSTATVSANLSNSYPLRVGVESQPININEYNQQNISSFKAYNRALSAAEVQRNFLAMRGRFGI